jgi:hypothetical protein
MNTYDLQVALYAWARSQLPKDVPVIWAEQSEPRPKPPYAVMKLFGPAKIARDELRSESPGVLMVSGLRRYMLSVNIFGGKKLTGQTVEQKYNTSSALELAAILQNSVEKPSVLLQIDKAGVSFLDEGDITNLTAMQETQFQSRAQFDVTVCVASNTPDTVGVIELVAGTGLGKDFSIVS